MLIHTCERDSETFPHRKRYRLAVLLLLAGAALCGSALKTATAYPAGDTAYCGCGVRSDVAWDTLTVERLADARVYGYAGKEALREHRYRTMYPVPQATTYRDEQRRCSAHQG